jgi:hypothetical protein
VKLNQPQILSVMPANTASGVSTGTNVQIVFDSPMDPLTFDTVLGYATLQLNSTNAVVPTTVSFSADFRTVTLTPSSPLSAGSTTYKVVVRSNLVTDMAGNLFGPGLTSTFTTMP